MGIILINLQLQKMEIHESINPDRTGTVVIFRLQ